MNGIKNKFMSPTVNDIIQNKDVIIILETHFNKRSNYPKNFFMVARSTPIPSKKPRGGVAVYRNTNSAFVMTCDNK